MASRVSHLTSSPGSSSRINSSRRGNTARSQRNFRPGGKPFAPRCQLSPFRLAEGAEFMHAFVDPVEDRSLPAASFAIGGDALNRMPAPAVGLPRQRCVPADGFERHIVRLRFLGGVRIVAWPLDTRAG